MAHNINGRGSATLGLISITILLIAALGGWYATWHYYRHHTLVAACGASNMHLSIGTTDGTAGTQYTHVVVTNQGSAQCTVAGWPAVFLTDAGNNVLGLGAAPSTLATPQAVTLQPGKAAHVVVGFPDQGNFPSPSQCSAASANLELFLPGAVSALGTPFVQYDCPGMSVAALESGQ